MSAAIRYDDPGDAGITRCKVRNGGRLRQAADNGIGPPSACGDARFRTDPDDHIHAVDRHERKGNTPPGARKSYVHPPLIKASGSGQGARYAMRSPRTVRYLSRMERGLIAILAAGGVLQVTSPK